MGQGGVGGSDLVYDDMAFVQWLNRQSPKIAVDHCTNLDIHQGSIDLSQYALLVCPSHDEYWSWEERMQVEAFIDNGGNVAFLSGNIGWKKVHLPTAPCQNSLDESDPWVLMRGDYTFFTNDASSINRPAFRDDFAAQNQNDPPVAKFDAGGVVDPSWWLNAIVIAQAYPQDPNIYSENRLTGQSYRNGGGRWDSGGQKDLSNAQDWYGYYVQIDPSDETIFGSWIFENTGLGRGDIFGKGEVRGKGGSGGVVEGEVDGVFINSWTTEGAEPDTIWYANLGGAASTDLANLPPQGYVLLAASKPLDGDTWTVLPPRTTQYHDRFQQDRGIHAATWGFIVAVVLMGTAGSFSTVAR